MILYDVSDSSTGRRKYDPIANSKKATKGHGDREVEVSFTDGQINSTLGQQPFFLNPGVDNTTQGQRPGMPQQ